MELAKRDNSSYELAKNLFQRKNSEKEFVIVRLDEAVYGNQIVNEFPTSVKILKYQFLLDVFNYFGHLITKLSQRSSTLDSVQSAEIMRLIHDRSRDSLIEFNMEVCDGTELDKIHAPFKNVQHFSISDGRFDRFETKFLKFNEIFPELRRLRFGDGFTVIDQESIIKNFKNLTEFYQNFANNLSEESILGFLRLNPTIQSLLLRYSEQFLKNVTEVLPNLTSLVILNLDPPQSAVDEIIFENVKELVIVSWDQIPLRNTTFKNLDTLIINITPNNFLAWESFIFKNKHITNLKFSEALVNDHFHKIARNMHELVNVRIDCLTENVDGQTIFEFVQQSWALKTLQLRQFDVIKHKDFLTEKLGNEWDMTFVSDGFIVFQLTKKN